MAQSLDMRLRDLRSTTGKPIRPSTAKLYGRFGGLLPKDRDERRKKAERGGRSGGRRGKKRGDDFILGGVRPELLENGYVDGARSHKRNKEGGEEEGGDDDSGDGRSSGAGSGEDESSEDLDEPGRTRKEQLDDADDVLAVMAEKTARQDEKKGTISIGADEIERELAGGSCIDVSLLMDEDAVEKPFAEENLPQEKTVEFGLPSSDYERLVKEYTRGLAEREMLTRKFFDPGRSEFLSQMLPPSMSMDSLMLGDSFVMGAGPPGESADHVVGRGALEQEVVPTTNFSDKAKNLCVDSFAAKATSQKTKRGQQQEPPGLSPADDLPRNPSKETLGGSSFASLEMQSSLWVDGGAAITAQDSVEMWVSGRERVYYQKRECEQETGTGEQEVLDMKWLRGNYVGVLSSCPCCSRLKMFVVLSQVSHVDKGGPRPEGSGTRGGVSDQSESGPEVGCVSGNEERRASSGSGRAASNVGFAQPIEDGGANEFKAGIENEGLVGWRRGGWR